MPEGHADSPVGSTPISDDYRAACFVTAADGANGHPVDAKSAFTDENHRYREDWRKLAKDQWDALVTGLRRESMAQLVGRGLAHGRMVPRGRQVGQLSIVSASPKPGTTADVPGLFQVLDVQASGF